MRTVPSLFGIAVAAFLAACGRPALPAPPPKGPVLEFRLDYAAARREGLAPPDATDEALQRDVIRILDRRLKAIAGPASQVERAGPDRVLVRLDIERDPKEATEAATRIGRLDFRIVVDPEHVREGQVKAPWDGTVDDWKKYREEEVAEWKKARDAALPYKPTKNPKYRVVHRANRPGSEAPEDFVVVLEPQGPAERFGGETLSHIRATTDERGLPAVSYEVKTEYRGVFGDWTGKHIQQPMALILNDELDQAPVVQSKLTDSVQITLGVGDLGTLATRRRLWIALLQSEPLPVRPELIVPAAGAPPK